MLDPEEVVAGQLCGFLNEANCLDPFQYGFGPHYGTEASFGILVDDLPLSSTCQWPLVLSIIVFF